MPPQLDPKIKRLRRRLYNRLPLVGGRLRFRAAQALAENGSPAALYALAEGLGRSDDAEVRALALKALQQIKKQPGIDAVCEAWAEHRSPDLTRLLRARAWVTSAPPRAYVLTRLLAGREEELIGGDVEVVEPLLAAAEDPEPAIAERARRTLPRLDREESQDALCRRLLRRRHPLTREVAGAMANAGSTVVARLLARAAVESNAGGARLAMETLGELGEGPASGVVCEIWAEHRHPALTDLLVAKQWAVSSAQSPQVRVLTALKVGRLDQVTGGEASIVEPLLAACTDVDPAIAERAREALPRLKDRDAQDALCAIFIERDDALARQAALAGGYTPREGPQRALFFFLTDQWDRYAELDFDQQMVRTLYTTAGDELRQRIREKLRTAGRTDFLSIVAGKDYRGRVVEMSPVELSLLTQTLIANREWQQLWKLLFEVSFCESVRFAQVLARAGWEPGDDEDRAVFRSLAALLTGEMHLPTTDAELREVLTPVLQKAEARAISRTPATLRAQVRVNKRVNDVAFSPTQPVIALGTSARKVVVWNYRRAEREHLLGPFDHSVGRVAYAGDGTLVWGERTSRTDLPCALYLWRDDEVATPPALLGRHWGSVTALARVDERRVISAGREGKVILWDIERRKQVTQFNMRYVWARDVQISPNRERAALLYEGVYIVALPKLKKENYGFIDRKSVSRCGAFLPSDYGEENWIDSGPPPENEALLVGHYNGDVTLYTPRQRFYWGGTAYQKETLTHHAGRVEGVHVLHSRTIAITAGSEGRVRFIDLRDRSVIGEVEAPGGQVTSLHVSPDGSFMAVGNSQASFSLWDLRGLDVLNLLLAPLGKTSVSVLPVIRTLSMDEDLPSRARRALKFAEQVLQYRVRFDIEVTDAPGITAGEFDIEIE